MNETESFEYTEYYGTDSSDDGDRDFEITETTVTIVGTPALSAQPTATRPSFTTFPRKTRVCKEFTLESQWASLEEAQSALLPLFTPSSEGKQPFRVAKRTYQTKSGFSIQVIS